MSPDADAILAEALSRLDSGEEQAACLRLYPEHSAQLAPLLVLATRMHQAFTFVEPPSDAAMAANRRRFLDAAAAGTPGHPLWLRWIDSVRAAPRPVRGLGLATAAILLFLLIGFGGLTASANSLPGDALYPVKRLTESARLTLSLDPQARQLLAEHLAARRRQEANAVVAAGRRAEWTFAGRLEAVENETWIINQVRLRPDLKSRLAAPPVGAEVEVFVVAPGDGRLIVRSAVIKETPKLLPTATLTRAATSSPTPTAPPSWTQTGEPPAAPVLDLPPRNTPPQGRVEPPDGTPAFQRTPVPMATRRAEIRTPGPHEPVPAKTPPLMRVPGIIRTVSPTRRPQTPLLPDGSPTAPSFHTRLPLPTHGPRVTPQPGRTPLPGPTSRPPPTRQHVPTRDEPPGPGPTLEAPPPAEPTEQATAPPQRHGPANPTRRP